MAEAVERLDPAAVPRSWLTLTGSASLDCHPAWESWCRRPARWSPGEREEGGNAGPAGGRVAASSRVVVGDEKE